MKDGDALMPALGSLFDGIGGFPLAGVRSGITPLWASEIEAFPIEVTKIRFPKMRHFGDITKLDGAELPPVDIITGGSPCQGLSVAGRRGGLADERSGLFMDQVRIVKEMRREDERNGHTAHAVRPRYMVWENVPGAFSSAGGEDFRAVLEEVCRIADNRVSVPRPPAGVWKPAGAILGDQFSVAWRVLDAQYWGVPQRRKRIFLVADFGGRAAAKILFEQDSLFGHPAPGRGPREEAAGAAPAGIGDTGGDCLTPRYVQRRRVYANDGVWPALYDGEGGGHGYVKASGVVTKGDGDCFLTSETHTSLTKGGGQAGQGYPCVLTAGFSAGAAPTAGTVGYQEECAPTLKGSSSGTNMIPSVLCLNDQGGRRMDLHEDVCGTLRSQMSGHPPLVMNSRQDGTKICPGLCPTTTAAAGASGNNRPALFESHGMDSRYTGPREAAPTLSARYGTGGNNVPLVSGEAAKSYCIAGNIIDREVRNGGNGFGCRPDISYTLNTADRHAVFSQQRSDEYAESGVAGTQAARQHKDATDLVCGVAGLDCRSGTENGDLCGTLQIGTSLNKVHPVRTGSLIRRLTPLECERLQGFPDGWTEIAGGSDSARYKALGNSVAIPCVEFVLRGIAYFLAKDSETKNK